MNVNVLRTASIITLLLCLGCTTIAANSSKNQSRLFRGRLQVMVADDFKNQTATIHYRLIRDEGGAVLRLKFLHGAPKPALRSGTRVEIRGHRHDGLLRVEALQVLGEKTPHQ